MLILYNNEIIQRTSPLQIEEAILEPLQHESGVNRWIIDEIDYTQDIQGYKLRTRTQEELEEIGVYQSWQEQQAIIAISEQAKIDFADVPTWLKTYSIADAQTYIDTNVIDLASAKTAMKHIAEAIILFRDYLKILS